MNMNAWSKKTKLLVALGISGILLATVAFAGTSATPGYDAFKEMLRTAEAEGTTSEFMHVGAFQFQVDVADKGEAIIQVKGSGQADETNREMSADLMLKSKGLDKQLQVYGNKEQVILLDVAEQAAYIVKPGEFKEGYQDHEDWVADAEDRQRHHGDWNPKSEALLDYFVGDMKNDFEIVTGTDGSKDIVLDLQASEIPAIVNLIAGMGDEDHYEGRYEEAKTLHAAQLEGLPLFNALKALETELPKITENIEVHAIRILFDRNPENSLVGLNFELRVSGTDKVGQQHALEVTAAFSENKEQPGKIVPITLDGKRIYEIKEQ